MEDHNIVYFRNLWQTNMQHLEFQCKAWEKICISNQIPDEVQDEIRSTTGLSRLLMNQKLKQFNGLIDDSEFNTGEKEITCVDLQGFWDMVYVEIEKINKCFNRLENCKHNDWKFIEEHSEKPLKKKVPAIKSNVNKKIDSTKSRALAAKQRLAEAKQKMLAQRLQQKEEHFVDITQSNKEELNHILSPHTDKETVKQSIKKVKNKNNHIKKVNRVNADEPTEECLVLNDASNQKIVQEKCHPISVQNKENFIPADDTFNLKDISEVQTKSKMKTEASVLGKPRRKTKEIIKLQCITRSAKKAMLSQQNTV